MLNEGFREVMYILLQNFDKYGLTINSIVLTLLLFGLIVPILSIMGPTREAMGKNLRASLDASRRFGDSESVSATVTKMQNWGLSGTEVILSLILLLFGVVTYYFIPLALLFEKIGLFLFLENGILSSLGIGMIIISLSVMHHL